MLFSLAPDKKAVVGDRNLSWALRIGVQMERWHTGKTSPDSEKWLRHVQIIGTEYIGLGDDMSFRCVSFQKGGIICLRICAANFSLTDLFRQVHTCACKSR
jgi:hypothetical protein